MKLRLLFVLCLFSFSQLMSQTPDYDAEFLTFERHEKFNIHKGKKFKEFIREVEVKRKIRVFTRFGVENYNRLYIPTYEDIDARSVLLDFKGKTIKSDGSEIILDRSNFRETTLPGNNKYLRNYEGSVKLIAFPQLDEGDIIEYSYTIRYIHDYSYNYSDSYEHVFQKDIPIRTLSYTFNFDEDVHVELLDYNLEESVAVEKTNDRTVYSFEYLDIEPIAYEEYSHEYDFLPHISLFASSVELVLSNSWEDRLEKIDRKPPSRFKFFSEYSMKELESQAKKLPTIEEKVRLICDSVYSDRRDSIGRYFLDYGSSYSNWYANNKYLRLFQKLGINSNIVFLRPLDEGEFDENLIALSQFSLSLIEFEDESGIKHYLVPRAPFLPIDYVPFEFQGSKALRVKDLFGNVQLETFQFPYSKSEKNSSSETREFSFAIKDDSLIYNAQIERNFIGKSNYLFLSTYLVHEDSTYSSIAHSGIDNDIFGRDGLTIQESNWNTEIKDYYVADVNLKGELIAKEKLESADRRIPLWKLIDLEIYDNWLDHTIKPKGNRKYDAHVGSAFKTETSIVLKNSENISLRRNDFMNVSLDNDCGKIECTTRNEGDQIIIELLVELKHGYVLVDEWDQFLEFDKALYSLLIQNVACEESRP